MLLKLNELLAYGKTYRPHSPFYYILKLFIMNPVTLVACIIYTSGLIAYLAGSVFSGCVDSFVVCMKTTELELPALESAVEDGYMCIIKNIGGRGNV